MKSLYNAIKQQFTIWSQYYICFNLQKTYFEEEIEIYFILYKNTLFCLHISLGFTANFVHKFNEFETNVTRKLWL